MATKKISELAEATSLTLSDLLPIVNGYETKNTKVETLQSFISGNILPDSIVTPSDVLTKTNTTEYIPTSEYHPTTKKYVDDIIADVNASIETMSTSIETINNTIGDINAELEAI